MSRRELTFTAGIGMETKATGCLNGRFVAVLDSLVVGVEVGKGRAQTVIGK